MTEDNCPDRESASLPFEKLPNDYEQGVMMFCYIRQNEIIEFSGVKLDSDIYGLNDIIVLPEFRGKGIGEELIAFCKKRAVERGAVEIRLGMIDDDKILARTAILQVIRAVIW